MPLPVIPADSWRQHQSQRFRERTDTLAAPFEEEERESAYRAQESETFRARTDALITDFDTQDRAQDAAAFRQRTDALIAPFEEQERAAATPTSFQTQPEPSYDPTRELTKTAPPRPDEAGVPKATGRVEALGQFEQGLPAEEAYSVCGPVAAQAFARANGRNPTLDEARALARNVGWTAEGGMNGVANQKRLLDEMGVASRLDTDVDFGEIAADASSGNPVIVSTAKHYYYVNGYDPNTGKLHVGKTGTARKDGAEWMSAEQIAALDGGINGALYVDHAGSPEPSVAARRPDAVSGQSGGTGAGFAATEAAPEEAPPAPTFRAPGVTAPERAMPSLSLAGLADAAGQVGTALATGADAVGGALGDAVKQLPGGEMAVDALRSQAAATTARRQRGLEAGQRVFEAAQRGEAADPADVEAMMAEPIEMATGVGPLSAKPESGLVNAAGDLVSPVKGGTAEILDQAGKVLREVAVRTPRPVKEEFLQPEVLMPAKDVSLGRIVLDRTRNVIESMGTAGKELGGRIHEAREGAELDAAAWVERMPTIRGMKDSAEFAKVVDVLEGRITAPTPRIAQAAAEAKGVLDDVFTRAQNAGVNVAEKIEDYFPHVYKPEKIRELTDVKRRAEMIRRVMNERRGTTEEEAEQIINRYVQASRDRRHGSLEMSRMADLPGYEKTREALYNHIASASRRINEVAQFGAKDEIKQRLVDRLGAEGYDATLANEMFKTIVDAAPHSEAARRISGAARVYHSVTRLGLSALLNATQSVNTATVTGTVRTLQSMAKALPTGGWSQAEREFADKTGVTLDTVIKEMKEGAGFTDKLGKLSSPGFGAVEVFNRRVAAIAGRDFAREMAEKAAKGGRGADAAKRALTKLRLDADAVVRRGGKLNEQEEIRAARAIVERTQFRVDPQDLPQWASHPLGKVVAQFRTFGYGQSAFVVREVMDEARKGNALPLVRFALLGPLAAGVATEARNVITGRDPEEDPTMRILQYGAGTLGVVGDLSRSVFGINSKYVPAERRVTQVVGSMLGPTVGTLTEGAVSGIKAAEAAIPGGAEGDTEGGMRFALRQVPLLGQLAVNRAFPYKKAEPPATPGRNRDSSRNTRDSSRSRSR